jgi:hypothetical protein
MCSKATRISSAWHLIATPKLIVEIETSLWIKREGWVRFTCPSEKYFSGEN